MERGGTPQRSAKSQRTIFRGGGLYKSQTEFQGSQAGQSEKLQEVDVVSKKTRFLCFLLMALS